MGKSKVNYSQIGYQIGQLVNKKQQAYGDSFGRAGACLREMYPYGIKPTQYDDVLTVARILDKLFRIANAPEAFNEDPYFDICGYGLLGSGRYTKNKINDNNRSKKTKRTNSNRKRKKGTRRSLPSKG